MKIGIILIILGIWVIKSNLENFVTNLIPYNLEYVIGILLINYGVYRLGKKNFSWSHVKGWFK